MAFLKILDHSNRQIDLPKPAEIKPGWELLIGRVASLDIHLASAYISGVHARVSFDGKTFQIADQDSTNGTVLSRMVNNNERRVTLVPHREFPLQTGDIIELGSRMDRIRFQDGPIEIGPNTSTGPDNPMAEVTMGPGESMTHSPLQEVLDGILEISRTLATIQDENEFAPAILSQLIRIFPKGQRFLLFATVPKTSRLRVLAWKINPLRRRVMTSTTQDDDMPRYSRTIYRMVVEERKSVILIDTEHELAGNESIPEMGIRSVMCAPIESPDGRVLGMLQIDADQKSKFQRSELEILNVISQQIGAAMHLAELTKQAVSQARLKAEMEAASQISRQFLPHRVPEIKGFEFFSEYQPAEDVGGDFYDFFLERPDQVIVSFCDVVGHGIPASLIMARFSSDLGHVLRHEDDPAAALEELDKIMTPVLNPPDSFLDAKFISMALARLDLKTARLTLGNAGHPPMLIRRLNGELQTPDVKLSGRLVGLDLGEPAIKLLNPFETLELQLDPGDVVVYYSDGLTEARNATGDYFGSPDFRLLAQALRETDGGPKAVGQAIMKSFKAFSSGQPQADDVTLVCFGPTADFKPVA